MSLFGRELDEYTRKHHTYNLYLTVLGFRPAFLASDNFNAIAAKFASDFNLGIKRGPYFDDDQEDVVYIINPKNSRRFEPLFQELKATFSKDEKIMAANFRSRQKLIGIILGFDQCNNDDYAEQSYSIDFWVVHEEDPDKRMDVFSYTCHPNNIEKSLISAMNLITKARKYFDPCELILSFEVTNFALAK